MLSYPLMGYDHTQHGRLRWLLWGAAVVCVIGAVVIFSADEGHISEAERTAKQIAGWLCLVVAGICGGLVFSFSSLTVRDEGDALGLQFGPLPIWRKRIAYADISDPQPARSKLIDGWGIHWFPGRGWTWNVWTFDCVEMLVKGKRFRVGSDDKEALAAFLQSKVEER